MKLSAISLFRHPLLVIWIVHWVALTLTHAEESKAISAAQQFDQRLSEASLAEARQLLHDWAVNVVLPELGNAANTAEEKFGGVRAMGQLILRTDLTQPMDVSALAYRNPDYWRGVVEMNQGNHLIAAMPAFMHLANGEWDLANAQLEILHAFGNSGALAAAFVDVARDHLKVCNQNLRNEINRGIAFHDSGQFPEAIAVYEKILATGIRSAWARYELFFSTASRGGQPEFFRLLEDTGPDGWMAAAGEIYAMDPLYTTQATGKRGKDMAALIDRMALRTLWEDKSLTREKKMAKYADLALKLEAYPVAAQTYWFTIPLKDTGLSTDEQIMRFLYSLDKLGVSGLQKEFKGNFPRKFKALDKALTKHRKS